MYNTLKSLHVLAVTLLAAGIGVESILGPIMGRTTNMRDLKLLATISRNAEMFALIPGVILIPIFGYATVAKGSWELSSTWLIIGQVLFWTAAAIGMGFLARASLDLHSRVKDMPDGPIPEDLEKQLRSPLFPIAGAALTIMFVAIVVDMVTKPGL